MRYIIPRYRYFASAALSAEIMRRISVADREQLVLGHDVLAGFFHVILVNSSLDDGINRAGLFAKSAIDALEQIDVVASRATRPVVTDVRLNRDCQPPGTPPRRACRLCNVLHRSDSDAARAGRGNAATAASSRPGILQTWIFLTEQIALRNGQPLSKAPTA